MKSKIIPLMVLVSFSCASCATIFNGTKDTITVRSEEPGSKIYIDEALAGTNNAIYMVPKKGQHTIRVSKNGCTDISRPIPYSFDATSLLGVLLDFGVISMLVVDGLGTGAITKADQTNFILTPECEKASAALR